MLNLFSQKSLKDVRNLAFSTARASQRFLAMVFLSLQKTKSSNSYSTRGEYSHVIYSYLFKFWKRWDICRWRKLKTETLLSS